MRIAVRGLKMDIPVKIDAKSLRHHKSGAKTKPNVSSNANLTIPNNTLAVSLNWKVY
jgi:hypothetical protein